MVQCHDHWVTFSVCVCVWMCTCVCVCVVDHQAAIWATATFTICHIPWPYCTPLLYTAPSNGHYIPSVFLLPFYKQIPLSSNIPLCYSLHSRSFSHFHFVPTSLLFDSYFLAVVSVILSVFLVSVYLFNSFRLLLSGLSVEVPGAHCLRKWLNNMTHGLVEYPPLALYSGRKTAKEGMRHI